MGKEPADYRGQRLQGHLRRAGICAEKPETRLRGQCGQYGLRTVRRAGRRDGAQPDGRRGLGRCERIESHRFGRHGRGGRDRPAYAAMRTSPTASIMRRSNTTAPAPRVFRRRWWASSSAKRRARSSNACRITARWRPIPTAIRPTEPARRSTWRASAALRRATRPTRSATTSPTATITAISPLTRRALRASSPRRIPTRGSTPA